jgi:SPP1 gp7 family putative phage head morphogenesis protein
VMEEATNRAANAATTTDPDPEQRTTITEQETPAGDANPATATEATPAPKAKKPAKKAVHKALTPEEEQLAAQREQEQDDLAQPIIPAVQGYFTNQQHSYLEALQAREALLEDDLDQYLNDPQHQDDAALYAILSALLLTVLQAGKATAEAQTGQTVAEERVAQPLRQYIQTDAFTHVQGINETTRKQLQTTLLEGIQGGEGIPELTNRVKTVFTQASDSRAALIARTEAAQAYAYANHATLQALATDSAVTRRRWLASEDERVCPICAPLDGYTIRFDAQYPGGLEPGNAHIQCRCTEVGLP